MMNLSYGIFDLVAQSCPLFFYNFPVCQRPGPAFQARSGFVRSFRALRPPLSM